MSALDVARIRKDFPLLDWIEPGSPAARAGLEDKDLLVAFDDRRVSAETLDKALRRVGPKAAVKVSYFREGSLRQAEMKTGDAISVDARSEFFSVTGGTSAVSAGNPDGRVRATIQPKTRPPEQGAAPGAASGATPPAAAPKSQGR